MIKHVAAKLDPDRLLITVTHIWDQINRCGRRFRTDVGNILQRGKPSPVAIVGNTVNKGVQRLF